MWAGPGTVLTEQGPFTLVSRSTSRSPTAGFARAWPAPIRHWRVARRAGQLSGSRAPTSYSAPIRGARPGGGWKATPARLRRRRRSPSLRSQGNHGGDGRRAEGLLQPSKAIVIAATDNECLRDRHGQRLDSTTPQPDEKMCTVIAPGSQQPVVNPRVAPTQVVIDGERGSTRRAEGTCRQY